MSDSPRRRGLRVVLLGPKRGANVGAACRAIKNMGAGELFVVGGEYDADEASRTSVHARDVFEARRAAPSLEAAVAECILVVGTTSRDQPWSLPVEPIGAVLAWATVRGLAAEQVALVFGPEDRGLSNEELARCHRVAFVPTADEYASLNLAQAVVVCLYEWLQTERRAQAAETRSAAAPIAALAHGQAEALADLRLVLEEIDFLHGDQSDRVMATVASMLTRGGLEEREVSILRGIVRQIRWAARRGRKTGSE